MSWSQRLVPCPRLQTRCWGLSSALGGPAASSLVQAPLCTSAQGPGLHAGDEAHRSTSSEDPSSEGQGSESQAWIRRQINLPPWEAWGACRDPAQPPGLTDEHLVPKDRDKNARRCKAAPSPGVNRTQHMEQWGRGCAVAPRRKLPGFPTS